MRSSDEGVWTIKELQKLLFEISSNERITILLELQQQKLKLSHISRKLKLNLTEASRHLQRLCEHKLIQKDSNGLYGLTQFGSLTLSLLSGLLFISRHRDYFLEYDVSILPYEFVDRIGELEEGVYEAETLSNIEEGAKGIREAREFIWILSDQLITSVIPALMGKVKGPFDLRIALPENMFPPESESRIPSNTPGVQKRGLSKVDALVIMTEKYAFFCLPNRSGRKDYSGFNGTDPKFRKWCRDLFLHYWEQAKPIGPAWVPKEDQ